LVERASVHFAFQRNYLALRDANRAVALDQNYPSAWGVRGGIYRQMGQYDRALQDLDKALELDPSYKWALRERREIQ
jgi:tetratricopeptide (TPR) repeat protein